MHINKHIAILLLAFSGSAFTADVVPYSVQSIKPVGAGYVELVGPGKMEVNHETLPYEGTKYIKISNIGTMTTVHGVTKGCMLAYASEGYTENISVLQQSCNQILSIIKDSQ